MAIFVLIHGGMHGGWCWDDVVPLLRARGDIVLAPDLPAMGDDRTPLDQVTLGGTADFVADVVRAQSDPVILVGHSLAGLVLSEVAERVPERLEGLVYVAAALLPSGVSLQEGPEKDIARSGIILSPDGISVSYTPGYALATFYNTTPPGLARRALERLTSQPVAPMQQPLKLTASRFGRVPRAYVECLLDETLPIALQRQMREVWPCDPVITLDTDHSPFLSAPGAFAEGLIAIKNKFGAK